MQKKGEGRERRTRRGGFCFAIRENGFPAGSGSRSSRSALLGCTCGAPVALLRSRTWIAAFARPHASIAPRENEIGGGRRSRAPTGVIRSCRFRNGVRPSADSPSSGWSRRLDLHQQRPGTDAFTMRCRCCLATPRKLVPAGRIALPRLTASEAGQSACSRSTRPAKNGSTARRETADRFRRSPRQSRRTVENWLSGQGSHLRHSG